MKGSAAVTFDQNGDVVSISSEKLREGLSGILSRLHRGDTLDEVIQGISGGFFESTEDFEKRFIKGNYNLYICCASGNKRKSPQQIRQSFPRKGRQT